MTPWESNVATFKTSGAGDVAETGFSLPTIFGSAMIAFGTCLCMALSGDYLTASLLLLGLIPVACIFALSSQGRDDDEWMHLRMWPVVRDTGSFLVCLAFCAVAVTDGEVDVLESFILCMLFIAYMLVVYVLKDPPCCCGGDGDDEKGEYDAVEKSVIIDFTNPMRKRPSKSTLVLPEDEAASANADPQSESYQAEEAPVEQSTAGATPAPCSDSDGSVNDATAGAADEAGHGASGGCQSAAKIVSVPIELLLAATIPDCQQDGWENWFGLTFLLASAYVVALSGVVLQCTQAVAAEVGMSPEVAGSTVLALGAQLPDCITAVAMSKSGMADGAISSAIGSQVCGARVQRLPTSLGDSVSRRLPRVCSQVLNIALGMWSARAASANKPRWQRLTSSATCVCLFVVLRSGVAVSDLHAEHRNAHRNACDGPAGAGNVPLGHHIRLLGAGAGARPNHWPSRAEQAGRLGAVGNVLRRLCVFRGDASARLIGG